MWLKSSFQNTYRPHNVVFSYLEKRQIITLQLWACISIYVYTIRRYNIWKENITKQAIPDGIN